MKTKINNPFSAVLGIIVMIVALFVMTSCSESGKDTSTPSTEKATSVKPPKVDINTAVVTNDTAAVRQHIAAGSNLNEKDPFGGSSPLISAAVFNKPEIAKMLIDAGADINFQNNDGSTALHTSAYFCRPEIVNMLVAKKADRTIRNKFGATAYDMVAGPFSEAKNGYDMIGKMLEPLGLKLDYSYIEKTRPVIATIVK